MLTGDGVAAGATRTAATEWRIWTMPISSPCRTSGNIPGTRPGIWPSTRLALGLVDPDFAKDQLALTLKERYLHPNGQMPAYEWNFGDVNPPVHAWATVFLYQLDRAKHEGQGDRRWLAYQFNKLTLNFSWWVNRKDRSGRNTFEGGFLGLDNIGIFDRCRPPAHRRLPGAGRRHRLMGVFCQHMVGDGVRALARGPALRGHGAALHHAFPVHRVGHGPAWVMTACGTSRMASSTMSCGGRMAARAAEGALHRGACYPSVPLGDRTDLFRQKLPEVVRRVRGMLEDRLELHRFVHPLDQPGVNDRRMLSIVNEEKLRRTWR